MQIIDRDAAEPDLTEVAEEYSTGWVNLCWERGHTGLPDSARRDHQMIVEAREADLAKIRSHAERLVSKASPGLSGSEVCRIVETAFGPAIRRACERTKSPLPAYMSD